MEIIKCPHCGTEISDYRTFCPYCGKTIRNSNMNDSKDTQNRMQTEEEEYDEYEEASSGFKLTLSNKFVIIGVVILAIIGSLLGKKEEEQQQQALMQQQQEELRAQQEEQMRQAEAEARFQQIAANYIGSYSYGIFITSTTEIYFKITIETRWRN